MNIKKLIQTSEGSLGYSEISEQLELSDRRSLRETTIAPALADQLIAYTIPEKPNSRLQEYRLTEKGEAALKAK